MGYIRDKLEPENQKYYYLQVLKILNNNGYKTISKDELRNELVLYRQKIFSNQINGNVKKKKKEENKDDNKGIKLIKEFIETLYKEMTEERIKRK